MFSRGMGAAYQSGIATPSDPICGGTFSSLDPTCWGFWLSQYVGRGTLFSTDLNAPAPPAPLPPPAPTGGYLTVPPVSGQDAQSVVDSTIAAGVAANQAASRGFFSNLDLSVCSQNLISGMCDWVTVAVAGAVGLAAFVALEGHR